MDAKTLIEGLAARAAELSASTEKNQTQENMILTAKTIQSLETKVGKDRAEKLYTDAGLDLSDPRERTRHRTLKAQLNILNKEYRAQSSPSGIQVRPLSEKSSVVAPPVVRACVPVSSSPPKATQLGRSTLLELIEQVFPLEAIGRCERMTVAALFKHVQKLVWQAGLKLPAPYTISDADMESRGVFRTDPKAAGVSRYLRAEEQAKIDYIFNSTNL
jgi:hypothetical protein